MRTLKTLALLVTLTFSSVLLASTNPKSENPTTLNEEIGKLLNKPQFNIEEDIEVFVKITFNKHDEIVVLSIETDNEELKDYITNRLNYNKITATLDSKIKYYIVPIRLTSDKK